ncbi:uncharacterized protein LOC117181163 [Belonocnema kinseyi]|uniref:uncharacterized protein LOC117181163 n=1 Tax=Belonocnema kinseyi TaxID=2817044 RepID=UPI00143D351F|nr:uncharacterized protein LOC117181163 [Belonocnema kinseyi]
MTSASVRAIDKSGNHITCKALLHTCSTTNFITERLMKRLKLPKTRCSLTIGAMNELNTTAKYFAKVTIKSINSEYERTLLFFIVPIIADAVPGKSVSRERFNIPKNIKLADPEFYKPSNVDLLIASGPTLSMFCTGQIKLNDNEDLILQKTKLGWIIGGHLNFNNTKKKSQSALKRLESLKKKLKNNKEFEKQYENGMKEYIKASHMTLIDKKDESSDGFYIPHLPVIKESSYTTKFRFVFDASAKSSNGNSLNDCLLAGPTIQDDLFSILLRFRKHPYVLIGI